MSEALSNRINSLPVSQTLAMAAKARELKGQGKDIISLSFVKECSVSANCCNVTR